MNKFKPKKNPYEVVEKVLKVAGYTIIGLLYAAVPTILISIAILSGQGVAVLAGLGLFVLGSAVVLGLGYLCEVLKDLWKDKRRAWERRNR